MAGYPSIASCFCGQLPHVYHIFKNDTMRHAIATYCECKICEIDTKDEGEIPEKTLKNAIELWNFMIEEAKRDIAAMEKPN